MPRPVFEKENRPNNRRKMSLPKQLEDALNGAPKYNPSMMDNARAPKLDLNRARRRMLDGEGPEDGEEGGGGRVSDKHSLESRMMDEIFSGMKREGVGGGAARVGVGAGGRGRRRRGSRGAEEKSDGNDSDNCSVSSVTSNMSSTSNSRPTPRGLSSNDIGGGQRKKSPRVRLSSKPNGGSSKDKTKDDLLTKMTGRLTMLEMTTKRLKEEKSKKDALVAKMRKKVSALEEAVSSAKANETAEALTHLADENDQLRKQIADMESFLSDYGLVWVGHNENNERLRGKQEGGEEKEEECGQGGEKKIAWEEERDAEKEKEKELTLDFDRDIFVKRMKELNSMIQADKAKIVTDGKKAKLAYADGVPICLFSDGIAVRRGKVRKWDNERCIKFVADILDGFFPAEFKDEFPDGVKLDLHDRRETHSGEKSVFKGEGNSMVYGAAGYTKVKRLANLGEANFQPMGKEEFLEKLPEKIVGGDGDVFDIRGTIKERMEGGEKGDEEGKEEEREEGSKGKISLEEKKRAAAEAAERRMRDAGTVQDASTNVENEIVLVETKAVQKLNSSLRMVSMGVEEGRMDVIEAGEGTQEEEGKEQDDDQPITTLRVKMDIGGGKAKTLIVKLGYRDTIGDLVHHVDTEKIAPGAFELRTAFPNKSYVDMDETLENAGLVPNASLNVRYIKAE